MARAVAVVEADREAARRLRMFLTERGFSVECYDTPGRLFDALLGNVPEAVVLGLPLPGMEGTDALRVLRGSPGTQRVCVVVLDSVGGPTRAVESFKAGADEVLRKPVDPEFLVVRLLALLERGAPAQARKMVRSGELSVDLEEHSCRMGDKEIRLTPIEFEILRQFLELENRVLTRGALLQSVWHGDPGVGPRTIDKHVEGLRRKLGPAGRCVETVFKVGYRFHAQAIRSVAKV